MSLIVILIYCIYMWSAPLFKSVLSAGLSKCLGLADNRGCGVHWAEEERKLKEFSTLILPWLPSVYKAGRKTE